ncbi:hypothetical protein GCM10011613_11350 [Cellvibrio zantedeschiae]|uniref:Uncharacterized protein n=1 Tax=Cellvibrio zantedeschiae TaxID=1237077 RepID=A0ABQ3AWX0_9GAMM|nr:hypothetical protein GCM10011613_11350 [Cellvibrio zantedeschiae]
MGLALLPEASIVLPRFQPMPISLVMSKPVRIWQDLSFSKPMPSPSGSEVNFAQNVNPVAVLELDDETLELLELELELEDELDEDEDELEEEVATAEL